MSRLPSPGSDDGQWGGILNDFLIQAHTAGGDLKPGIVTNTQLADSSVTATKLSTSGAPASGQVLSYSAGSLTWTTPVGGSSAVSSVNGQTGAVVLAKSDIGLSNVDNTADTAKPLSDATVVALNAKADDSATVHTSGNETISGTKNFTGTLQVGSQAVVTTTDSRLTDSRTPLNGSVTEAKLSAGPGTNGQVLSSNGSGTLVWTTNTASGTISDADANNKGIVQLAGDLGGTAGSPQVAKVNGVSLPGTAPTAGQVLTASSATAATWSTPSAGGVTSVAGRTGVITLGESDIANLTTDLAAKAPLASPTFTGTVTAPALKVSGGTPGTGKVLTSDATGNATWQAASGGSVSDASSSTKGIVQLTNDFGGTAAAPTVVATHLSSALPVAQGGTGSTTQNFVDISTAQTVAGVKTFSASPIVPTPTSNSQAANKTYVDTAVAGVSGGGNGNRTVTAPKTAAYTANAGEYVLVNATAGGFTVTLPASPANGAWVSVKKVEGTSNAVLVVPNTGANIEDNGNMSGVSVSVNSGYMDADFIFSSGVWYRVG